MSVYGGAKLAGERAVAAANPAHVILRTAWVYSPFGANFVKTMLRLGETRAAVNVVADQWGCPTSALDIADAILAIARRLRAAPRDPSLYGVFHLVGSGEATWAEFAKAIFAEAERSAAAPSASPQSRPPTIRRSPGVPPIRVWIRPRLQEIYGIRLPDWRASLAPCVARLLRPLNCRGSF